MEDLEHSGHEVINYGADVTEGVDFPIFAKKLGNGVLNKEIELDDTLEELMKLRGVIK